MSTTTHQPAMRAFTVINREGQDDFWLAIGAAFKPVIAVISANRLSLVRMSGALTNNWCCARGMLLVT